MLPADGLFHKACDMNLCVTQTNLLDHVRLIDSFIGRILRGPLRS